ncbi:unnamed protein product [Arctogadus glacialis]
MIRLHSEALLHQEVEEPQLRQVSRHDTDVGHGVWKFWERGEQGAGAELDFVHVVGAGPIQWVWPHPRRGKRPPLSVVANENIVSRPKPSGDVRLRETVTGSGD